MPLSVCRTTRRRCTLSNRIASALTIAAAKVHDVSDSKRNARGVAAPSDKAERVPVRRESSVQDTLSACPAPDVTAVAIAAAIDAAIDRTIIPWCAGVPGNVVDDAGNASIPEA